MVKPHGIVPNTMFPPVLERDTGEAGADAVQARVVRAVDNLSKSPAQSRRLVVGVQLPGGATALPVEHGLSGPITSWTVAGMRANAVVFEPDPTRRDDRVLYLRSSAACTFDLEVW